MIGKAVEQISLARLDHVYHHQCIIEFPDRLCYYVDCLVDAFCNRLLSSGLRRKHVDSYKDADLPGLGNLADLPLTVKRSKNFCRKTVAIKLN